MNLRKSKGYTAEVYTGSLNDIMFFLLLFFLIVSTMVNPSVVKLMLPKATTAQAMNKKQVTLSMTADKTYYINNKAIASEQLETEMANAVRNLEDPTIVLRIDNALTIQDLVDLLQIGNKLKIKMVLATKSTQK
ncbi:MAG: biopolymer transporter ExbD [Bacteroidota bacterium]